jgi:hypothetical protein
VALCHGGRPLQHSGCKPEHDKSTTEDDTKIQLVTSILADIKSSPN